MTDARGDREPDRSSALRGAAASVIRVDLAAISLVPAIRAATGCVAVLGSTLAVVGPGAAAAATVGALLAAIPALSGVGRRPLAAMATTTCGIALSSFVGSTTAGVAWLHLVVLATWAFAGGMLVALGDAGSVVGTQAAMAFVVFGRFAADPAGAVKTAGYVAVGGAFQIALTAATRWPLALRAQRRDIADAYRVLGELALGDPEASSLPAGRALDAAELALSSPSALRRSDVSALQSLVDEGRRIRVELASLEALRLQLERAARHTTPGQGAAEPTAAIDGVLAEAACILAGVAGVVIGQRPVSTEALDRELLALDGALRQMEFDRGSSDPGLEGARARPDRSADEARALVNALGNHLAALGGQLRAVANLAAQSADSASVRAARPVRAMEGSQRSYVLAQMELLRANLSLRSAACRHAVRLAVVIPLAELVAAHTPLQRGYWIALTAALVLRPDFGGTLSRGFARLAGTIVGVGITGIVVAGGTLGNGAAIVVIGVLAFGAFLSFRANYAAYSAFLTGLVVILVNLATPGAHATLAIALDRLVDTLIGGALALAVYVTWPTWTTAEARHSLAELARAEGDYLAVVTDTLAGQARRPEQSTRALARRLRLARSNCEATIARSLGEPRARQVDAQLASGALAALRRCSLATHVLRTSLELEHPVPELAPLADALVCALGAVAAALEGGVAPGPSTLRGLHGDMTRALAARPGNEILIVETDELVDAIDTIAVLLARPATVEV